ncbi:MAG TPA: hypothetical protein VGP82_20765, partial [Ktedonobacterales bacterium]|nr:hypothetical protein [Ktedonobacterales bacterium]
MGNGHTNRRRRGGGGNSRARHGPQRQQTPEVVNGNGQMHPEEPAQQTQQTQQAMKTAAAPAQPAPRQAPREQTPRPEREPRRHSFQPQPGSETATRPRRDWPPARTEAPSGPYRPSFASTPGTGAHNGFKHVQPEKPLARTEEEDWGESEGEPATGPSQLVRSYSYNGSETRDKEIRPEVRGEFAPLIDSLKELFQHDRAAASQGNSTRCGICYLHFTVTELEYRE